MALLRNVQALLALPFLALAAPAKWGPAPEGVLVDSAVDRAVNAGLDVDDHQIVERPEGRAEFRRASYKVVGDPMGIPTEVISRVEFDPSRQEVLVHWVRLRRGSTDRQLAPELRYTKPVFRGEPGVVWCDPIQLQEGDILDRAWSVVDRTPLRGGGAFGEARASLNTDESWARLRLVWDRSDSLHIRSSDEAPPLSEPRGTGRILTWLGKQRAAGEQVEWSSFRGWNEVGDWLATWFRPDTAPGPLVAEELARIRSVAADEEAKIVAALDRVQALEEDGTTIGGFRVAGMRPPRDPETVLRAGRGDGADKALVLLALLRGLGIPAQVAVAARPGEFLAARVARPSNLLDRFLVRVEAGGRVFLLHPMDPPALGNLAERSSWSDVRILPIGPSSPGFVPAPARASTHPDLDVQVELTAPSFQDRGSVVWTIEARGEIGGEIQRDPSLAEDLHGVVDRDEMAVFEGRDARLPIEVAEQGGGLVAKGGSSAQVWEEWQEGFWIGHFKAQPVMDLSNQLRKEAESSRGFRMAARHLRGAFVVRLPEGASDEDSLHAVLSRAGVRFEASRTVRDGVARIAWEFSSPAIEVEGDSLESWLGTLDSIRSLSEFTVEQDRRTAMQRLDQTLSRVLWVYAGFFVLVLAGGSWAARIVWRRNPALREQVFGKAVVSTPAWWSLYPATLALSALWAIWGLVETMPGVLGLDDGPYRPVSFLERMMEFQACSARLFVLPGFVLLFRLFRARRTSFRGINLGYLLIGSLWFLLEAWLRLGFGRIDLFRVVVMVGLFASWQFWMVYFARSTLAPTVFRNRWTPSKELQSDPDA